MPCGSYYHESYPSELEQDFVRGLRRTERAVTSEVESHKFWPMAALAAVLILACMYLSKQKK